MNKFYVTCGEIQALVLAHNPIHACIKTFQNLSNNPTIISTLVRVSQCGFNQHEDDDIFSTESIFRLLLLSRK